MLSTDIETGWNVLRIILGGASIEVGDFVGSALFNRCNLVTQEDVKAQTVKLAQWTTDKVLEGIKLIIF